MGNGLGNTLKRRLQFLALVVRRGASPALTAVGAVTLLVGGSLLAFADLGRDHPGPVSVVLIAALACLGTEGAYRLWDDADIRARSYEGDTELQRGIGGYLRAGREIRGRLIGASELHVAEVAVELWSWVGLDVEQWLDMSGADELQQEWRDGVPGVDANDMDEFAQAVGGLSRAALVAHADRALALLMSWQARLRGD
jgi:hypothetical protein